MSCPDIPPGGQEALRRLPAVDFFLRQPAVANLLAEYPRQELVRAVREVLDECRAAIREGRSVDTSLAALGLAIRQKLHERSIPALRRAINATGIVLHTGLGRAPLCREAIEAIAEVAGGYCNLELDLASGGRGDRHEHLRPLLRELTGAEDGLVVNNNAAATYLVLNTLAAGREVIVSRGQLVEIGGSYRMPDIMAAAGCRMVEVGTTNRTRLSDYERAIGPQTAVLLRVHTSNYRIRGFVQQVELAELVSLGRRYGLVVVDDLGSGLLDRDLPRPQPGAAADETESPGDQQATTGKTGFCDVTAPTTWDEPSVRESVAAGADLTLFSGDKLLGGPQAGIIVGRADLIARLRGNPIARTVRPDKLTLAGLQATLRLYRDPQTLRDRHPVFRMLLAPLQVLEESAATLEHAIRRVLPDVGVVRQPGTSEAGGGSLPTLLFPTWTVCVRHPRLEAALLGQNLRRREVPVICRIQNDALVFDCRTLLPGDIDEIARALGEVVRELSGN